MVDGSTTKPRKAIRVSRKKDVQTIRDAAKFLHKISALGLYAADVDAAKGFAVDLDGIVVATGIEALQNTDGRPATDEPGWEGCIW